MYCLFWESKGKDYTQQKATLTSRWIFYFQVLEKYENDPNFLLEVFNSPSEFLEDLTGLSLLHSTAAELDVLEFSDDDDF